MISLGGLVSQRAFGKFEMGRVISNPFATAFVNEAEGEDHEVSMANNSLDTIIKMATELKAKMGENEKDIPAWIQDHITNAENFISQASSNYHEYGTNELKVNEEEIRWNAVENAIINFLKMNTKILDKRVKDKDVEGVKGGLKSIISGLTNAQRSLKLESVNEASPCWKGYKQVGMKDKGGRQVPNCVPNESVVNEDINAIETLMLIRNLEQTNKLLVQDLKTSKGLSSNKKENIKKSIAINQGLINHYKEIFKNLKNNESVNEDTRRAKLLGIDFNISEMNGRIFFSFVDKKAASIKIREIGTNKIVNLIQKSLDNAYGKGEFFFKGGDHAEFQNGYLFQRNLTNVKLNKLKFESVNEASGRVPQIFLKTGAVEKKIKELMADRKKAVVPYNTEKDPKKKEILKQILIKLTKQIQGYEKNLIQLRDKEEEYIQQMQADVELDTSAFG